MHKANSPEWDLKERVWVNFSGLRIIGEKGTDWGFSEKFGNTRVWRANYRSRQLIRLFDRSSWLNISRFFSRVSYLIRTGFRMWSDFIVCGTCQIPGIG